MKEDGRRLGSATALNLGLTHTPRVWTRGKRVSPQTSSPDYVPMID